METGRKSFIVHLDSLDVLDELTDEQCGILFKAMRDYNMGKDLNISGLIKAVFIPFRNQFDRDIEKWNVIVLRNRENGAKGGKPKGTQTNPLGILGTQDNPDKPDNKNKNDSDSKNENKSETNSDASLVFMFEEFRKKYPGTKRGFDAEIESFKKKHKDWSKIIPILLPCLENQIRVKKVMADKNIFVPQWAHLQTFLNQRKWEEFQEIPKESQVMKPFAEEEKGPLKMKW